MGCGIIKYMHGTDEDRAKIHKFLFYYSAFAAPFIIAFGDKIK